MQDCCTKIARQEESNKKPGKFLGHVISAQNELHLALALVKQKLVVDPII